MFNLCFWGKGGGAELHTQEGSSFKFRPCQYRFRPYAQHTTPGFYFTSSALHDWM